MFYTPSELSSFISILCKCNLLKNGYILFYIFLLKLTTNIHGKNLCSTFKGGKKLDVSLSLEFVSHYYIKFTIMSFSFVHIKIDINIVILKFYISQLWGRICSKPATTHFACKEQICEDPSPQCKQTACRLGTNSSPQQHSLKFYITIFLSDFFFLKKKMCITIYKIINNVKLLRNFG